MIFRWIAALLFITSAAQAQVKQSGKVTPGHIGCWTTTGVVQDCGTPANPFVTGGLGIISPNAQSIVIDNAKISGAYNQLGFGITASAANITSQAFGGATDLPLNIVAKSLNFIINGVPSTGPFVPTGGGTITGNLIINGTLVVGGVPVPGPAGPFLSTGGGTVNGLTTFSGAGVGLSVTNNATIGGALNLTSSPGSPSPQQGFLVLANNNYAFPPNGGDYRGRYWSSTITANSNSSGIEESNFFATFVNGSGTLSNEINVVHPYLENNGVNMTGQSEAFESSMLNNGHFAQYQTVLAQLHNGATGTASSLWGVNATWFNDNTTVGAIGAYAAFNCNGMGGPGAHPTFEYCIRNVNPQGAIATAGAVRIGSFDLPENQLEINAPGHTGAVVPFIIKNDIGNVAFIDDSGNVHATKAFLAPFLALNGTDNSASTFPILVRNLAGTLIFDLNNNGDMLVGALLSVVGDIHAQGIVAQTGYFVGVSTGVTCGPGAPTAGFQVVGGIVIAC